MKMKQQITSNSPFLNLIKADLLGLLTLFFLSACATPPPYITFSEPKVYSDDQVATALGGQYRKLQDTVSTLTAKELQEVFEIRQGTRLNTNISASPAGIAPVTAPGNIESDTIDLTKLTMPAGETGLSYSASLRKKMNDAWEVLGRSLFLSGDQTLKKVDNNVVLVRFDVSVNNYIPADAFGDAVRFAYIRFTITDPHQCETDHKSKSLKCNSPQGLKIYALEPEFNSSVSKESLITDALEDYRGEIGGITEGVDIQGAFRYQRALYEGFQKLVEQPLQFSVYGSTSNQFGCALGPMRQIVKRSWINPARIFGNKYRIDHIIEPGARQCYAIIVLPKEYDTKRLIVKAEYYRRDFLNKGDLLPATGPNGGNCVDAESCGIYQNIGHQVDRYYRQPLWGDDWSTNPDLYITVPAHNGASLKDNSLVSIFPKTTSTVLVSTLFPLSPDTRVLIGPAEVDPKNVELLGRNRLKVTVPPDKALQELLTEGKGQENQKMIILAPGCQSGGCKQTFDVLLKDSKEVPQDKPKRDPNLKEETSTKKFVYPDPVVK